MVVTEKCQRPGCDGDVAFDLGPRVDVEETQAVEARCPDCGEVYTLRTNLNRRMR